MQQERCYYDYSSYNVHNLCTLFDRIVMQRVKITELRANLPDFLNKVRNGEQIQITSHGKVIARLVPEISQVEAAQQRLDAIRGTMIIGDIMEPINGDWSADADNL